MKSTIEWHSVDEMLPDVSGLMPGEHEYVPVRYKYSDCAKDSGVAAWDRNDSFGFIDPDMITHWAYLPNAREGFEGLQ